MREEVLQKGNEAWQRHTIEAAGKRELRLPPHCAWRIAPRSQCGLQTKAIFVFSKPQTSPPISM